MKSIFLIVEDHDFQREMLEHGLRLLGVKSIHSACSAKEALDLLRTTKVDIAIVDLMMPDMNGIELIPLLRETAPDTAVIFSSADEVLLRAAAKSAKANGLRLLGVVSKPLTPIKLRALLADGEPAGTKSFT